MKTTTQDGHTLPIPLEHFGSPAEKSELQKSVGALLKRKNWFRGEAHQPTGKPKP